MSTIPTKYKQLKVVDIEGTSYAFPKHLESLIHLKYLTIRCADPRLPKSIGLLHNLEYLDVRGTLFVDIPKEINKLRKTNR